MTFALTEFLLLEGILYYYKVSISLQKHFYPIVWL